MGRLLHVEACPNAKQSSCGQVAAAFTQAFREHHPGDEVSTLDLWSAKLPELDRSAAVCREKLLRNLPRTNAEEAAWEQLAHSIAYFKSFDKFVVTSPEWSFSVPYPLKKYIDVLLQPGQTYEILPDGGSRGLVTRRPILLILSRCGANARLQNSDDRSFHRSYLEAVFGAMGFENIHTIAMEESIESGSAGGLAGPIARAERIAATF